jgi:hypothetical protein
MEPHRYGGARPLADELVAVPACIDQAEATDLNNAG